MIQFHNNHLSSPSATQLQNTHAHDDRTIQSLCTNAKRRWSASAINRSLENVEGMPLKPFIHRIIKLMGLPTDNNSVVDVHYVPEISADDREEDNTNILMTMTVTTSQMAEPTTAPAHL